MPWWATTLDHSGRDDTPGGSRFVLDAGARLVFPKSARKGGTDTTGWTRTASPEAGRSHELTPLEQSLSRRSDRQPGSPRTWFGAGPEAC